MYIFIYILIYITYQSQLPLLPLYLLPQTPSHSTLHPLPREGKASHHICYTLKVY